MTVRHSPRTSVVHQRDGLGWARLLTMKCSCVLAGDSPIVGCRFGGSACSCANVPCPKIPAVAENLPHPGVRHVLASNRLSIETGDPTRTPELDGRVDCRARYAGRNRGRGRCAQPAAGRCGGMGFGVAGFAVLEAAVGVGCGLALIGLVRRRLKRRRAALDASTDHRIGGNEAEQ